jgi:hypothetical protein
MYHDNRPCDVCGSEVRLTSHRTLTVHEPDDTVDERICTNPGCPTNSADLGPDTATP